MKFYRSYKLPMWCSSLWHFLYGIILENVMYVFVVKEHVSHLGCDEWLTVAVVTLTLNLQDFGPTSTSVF
jgi:hypothetical protein